jgi:hypothetical protein
MSRFSPSDAALEGFRLTRERPWAVLAWAGARLVISGATMLAYIASGGRAAFDEVAALQASGRVLTPEATEALLGRIAPSFLLFSLVGLFSYALFYTAVLRAVLRPQDKAFAYLRLSLDEARQFALAVILFLVFFCASFLVALAWSVGAALAHGPGALGTLVQLLAGLGLAGALIYAAVRLSLAAAMTFSERRLVIFASLPLTRGQVWSLLGAYVLGSVLTLVVILLAAVIFMFVVGAIGLAQDGATGFSALMDMAQSQASTLSGMLGPLQLAKLVFNALLTTLGFVILTAPSAAIYRELKGLAAPPGSVRDPANPWA